MVSFMSLVSLVVVGIATAVAFPPNHHSDNGELPGCGDVNVFMT